MRSPPLIRIQPSMSSSTISTPISRKTTAGSSVTPTCISTSPRPVLPGSIKSRSGSRSCKATRSRTRHSPRSNNSGSTSMPSSRPITKMPRTIWLFREKLTKAGAIGPLFERFDATLRQSGYIAMSGQIVDASLIAAPRQRNTQDEKKAKDGRIPDDWKDKPAKLRQKDRDARWTVKYTKAKPREDGSTPPVDLAIPVFGYQNHISLDRGFGFIRKWSATDAAAYEGRRLRDGLLDKTNTASSVWADTAYGSAANEEFMESNGFVSDVLRKRPKGRPIRKRSVAPTPPNQKSVRASSTSSPSRRIGWVC